VIFLGLGPLSNGRTVLEAIHGPFPQINRGVVWNAERIQNSQFVLASFGGHSQKTKVYKKGAREKCLDLSEEALISTMQDILHA